MNTLETVAWWGALVLLLAGLVGLTAGCAPRYYGDYGSRSSSVGEDAEAVIRSWGAPKTLVTCQTTKRGRTTETQCYQ